MLSKSLQPSSLLFPSVSLRAYHGKASTRVNRMKQIYTCVP